jgi:hypothetical protein
MAVSNLPPSPRFEPNANLSDDLVLRATHLAIRQYRHYGKRAPNEQEYRDSLKSWLEEMLRRLE